MCDPAGVKVRQAARNVLDDGSRLLFVEDAAFGKQLLQIAPLTELDDGVHGPRVFQSVLEVANVSVASAGYVGKQGQFDERVRMGGAR